MAEEKKTTTSSWGDDVSKVIESIGRGLGSVLNPGGMTRTPAAPEAPIVITQPAKTGKGLIIGLVAVVAIGGLVFYLTNKNKK